MMEVLFTLLVYIFGTKIMDWKRGTSSDIPMASNTQASVEAPVVETAAVVEEVKEVEAVVEEKTAEAVTE
jgi:hypothetical protein